MRNTDWPPAEILRIARTSGKPLEVECAEAFLAAGWTARLGSYYADGALDVPRELDVLAEKSVKLDIFFTRRLGVGMFAGEGFILQKLTGPGMAFAELDGDAIEYHLGPNQVMRVEPGHVAMFESSVTFNVEMIQGLANMFLGGEGLFLATLKGPGRIWLHSMTESKMAQRLAHFMPSHKG